MSLSIAASSTATPKVGDQNQNETVTNVSVTQRLKPGELFELENIQLKKVQQQKLIEAHALVLSAPDNGAAREILKQYSFPLPHRNAELEKSFSNGKVALSRTLLREKRGGDGPKFLHPLTPIKREILTRTDRLSHGCTVATSSTLIHCNIRQLTVSHTRQEWEGMPSLIFMSSLVRNKNRNSHHLMSHPDDNLINRKFGVGYKNASSSTPSIEKLKEVYDDQQWDLLSHSLQIRRITQARAGDKKTWNGLDDTAKKLISRDVNNQSQKTQKTPNDYVSRLELWDTHAIEIGRSKPLAIATWLEHEVERQAIVRQMQREGIEGGIFNRFLLRQLSWPLKKGDPSFLGINPTQRKWEAMPSERKVKILSDILAKLEEPVSLCEYKLTQSGSRLHSLDVKSFSREDIQSGMSIYLRSFAPNLIDQARPSSSNGD